MSALRQAAEKALEALEACVPTQDITLASWLDAMNDLRAALAAPEQAAQPVAWSGAQCKTALLPGHDCSVCGSFEAENGDAPCAWITESGLSALAAGEYPVRAIPHESAETGFTVPLFLHAGPQPVACSCKFDAWQENPYTKVLMESIKKDYVPRNPSPEYAAPQPAPVALTDEQIKEIALQDELLLICDDLDALTEITRAIERAHGIGAQP
jgi:hypothetical protein